MLRRNRERAKSGTVGFSLALFSIRPPTARQEFIGLASQKRPRGKNRKFFALKSTYRTKRRKQQWVIGSCEKTTGPLKKKKKKTYEEHVYHFTVSWPWYRLCHLIGPANREIISYVIF